MSIDRKQLDVLSGYRNEKNPVVSLYLNVTAPRNYQSELNSLIHNTLHSIEDRYDRDRLKGLGRVFTRIEEYARGAFDNLKGTRMVAIFADNDGYWQELHLPVALPSRIVVEADPYIRPLSRIMDEFNRYCVLVCDSRQARIFALDMGRFEENSEILIEDDVPDRVRVHRSITVSGGGVQGGMGDEKNRRHIQDHMQRHFKNTADKTFACFRENGFNRLIIGGADDRGNSYLKNHLHSYLKQRLIGEFTASPSEATEDLRRKALEAARDYERRYENERIGELFEKKGRGMGALGVEPVIEALMMGQVHTLIMDDNFEKEGYVCAGDHILSTYLETCPVCGGEMEKTDDLAEEMVEEALFQNSEVEHVLADHEDFGHYQVGAILRFSM